MSFSAPIRAALNALILQALTGLKNQNWEQSYSDEAGSCMYRGPNHTRCFVGHLIPTTMLKRFTTAQNEDGIQGLMDARPKLWDKWFPEIPMGETDKANVIELFRLLQSTHDSSASANPDTMKFNYRETLKGQGFYTPEIAAVLV